MKKRTRSTWVMRFGWLVVVSGCDSGGQAADPCAVDRDSPACLDALDTAAEELAAADCEDYIACYPLSERILAGPADVCVDRRTRFYSSVRRLGGIAATPADLHACADALRRPDCTAWEEEACKLAGRKKPGDACVVDYQCESLRCVREAGLPCGICEAARSEGQPCTFETDDCGYGLVCSAPSAGTCQPKSPAGAPCQNSVQCTGILVCIDGVCKDQAAAGEPCTSVECDDKQTLYCNSITHVCDLLIVAAAGSFCGWAPDGRIHACDFGLWCSDGTCVPRPLDGQSCAELPCMGPAECYANLCVLDDFPACP